MFHLEKNNDAIAQTKKEQDEKLKNKENEILDLKKRIEDMSAEFAKMLKDTLEKMQERIRLAEWDNDNDPSVIKKIKEMNSTNWSSIIKQILNQLILFYRSIFIQKIYLTYLFY